jgi:hypothetical protein
MRPGRGGAACQEFVGLQRRRKVRMGLVRRESRSWPAEQFATIVDGTNSYRQKEALRYHLKPTAPAW